MSYAPFREPRSSSISRSELRTLRKRSFRTNGENTLAAYVSQFSKLLFIKFFFKIILLNFVFSILFQSKTIVIKAEERKLIKEREQN